MTAPVYTLAALEAKSDRELDAAVAGRVFGFEWGYSVGLLYSQAYLLPQDHPAWVDLSRECPFDNADDLNLGQVPRYSDSWEGFGEISERMRELSFALEVSSFCGAPSGAVGFSKNHRYDWVHGDNLPRAAAIAAVLALQKVL